MMERAKKITLFVFERPVVCVFHLSLHEGTDEEINSKQIRKGSEIGFQLKCKIEPSRKRRKLIKNI